MTRRAALAAVLALTCAAGCAPLPAPREVEQLQLIQTLGYDCLGGRVRVSVSSGREPDGGVSQLTAEGGSITEAIRRLQDYSPREELFFAHVRFAAVGEDAAGAGLGPLLDYFERNTQTPLDLPLFVVRGAEAEALVAAAPDPAYEVTALLASLQRDAERMGTEHCFTVLEIARRLSRSGSALCAAVRPVPSGDHVPSAPEGALSVLPAGYAVLRDGALAGYLDEDAALGADLILGLAGQACTVLPLDGGRVTVQLRASRSETVRGPDGGTLVRIRCRAGVVESDGAGSLTGASLGALAEALAGRLAACAAAALEAETRLDTDFLELGRTAGEGPSSVPPHWRAEVTAVIERSYDLADSARVDGREDRDG